MDRLDKILYKILHALEYIDDDLIVQQNEELLKMDLHNDCIAVIHSKLLSMM